MGSKRTRASYPSSSCQPLDRRWVQSTDDGEGERRAGWGNACDAILKRLLIPAEGHSSDVAFSLPQNGGADLEGAIVTDEQLAQAKSLEGATLPDGMVHE